MSWKRIFHLGIVALCLAIIGHMAMDLGLPITGHSIWTLSFIERTIADAWGIWLGLIAWRFLKWGMKDLNGE